MNYPTIEQFNQLEKKYYELAVKVDRLDAEERKQNFNIQDCASKVAIAEGLTESNYKDISQLRLEIHQARAEMKAFRQSVDEQFDGVNRKLDRQEAMTKENGDLLRQLVTKLNNA